MLIINDNISLDFEISFRRSIYRDVKCRRKPEIIGEERNLFDTIASIRILGSSEIGFHRFLFLFFCFISFSHRPFFFCRGISEEPCWVARISRRRKVRRLAVAEAAVTLRR